MGRTLGEADGGGAEPVLAAQVTCDFFPLLGVKPLHGHLFEPDECRRASFSHANAPAPRSRSIAGSVLSSIAAIASPSPRSRAARATSNGSGPEPAISPSTLTRLSTGD